jgi:hypothetical protein
MVLPLDDLPLSKVAKQAFLGHQLVASTLLHDASLVEDEDAVRVQNGAEAVRDDDACGIQLFQAAAHCGLRLVIERAGGFVEEQDTRPLNVGACDQQTLALSAGEPASTFTNNGVHAHRHGLNIFVQTGCACRLPRIVNAQRSSADDVGEDIAVGDAAVLQHHIHLAAQRLRVDIVQIQTVEVNEARLRLLKAEQQTEERGFA